MNRIFGLLIVICVIVAVVGMYRGWFSIAKSGPDDGSHKVNINLTVDQDKIKEDAAAVEEEAKTLTGQGKK